MFELFVDALFVGAFGDLASVVVNEANTMTTLGAQTDVDLSAYRRCVPLNPEPKTLNGEAPVACEPPT